MLDIRPFGAPGAGAPAFEPMILPRARPGIAARARELRRSPTRYFELAAAVGEHTQGLRDAGGMRTWSGSHLIPVNSKNRITGYAATQRS